MEDDIYNQYASIDEVKDKLLETTGITAAALNSANEKPPLPPPNHPKMVAKAKASSEENMSNCNEVDGGLHSSNSTPLLTSTGDEETDAKKTVPLYATVNKECAKNKPDSEVVSSPPPPLPPPISPDDIPNGDMPGLVLVPQNGSGTEAGKRPVPIPRSHVYEVVPDNIITEKCTMGKSSCRKSTKKKKGGGLNTKVEKNKDKNKSFEQSDPPLISLNDLEPLPTGGKPMKLLEFVNRFGHYLPLRVKVDEGYCGTEERFVISSGDVYNFHFVKSEKIASIRDCGGTSFSIPLNSAIEFGALYNPSKNFKAALKGYVFKTVSELAACKHLPKIICATRSHITGDAKTSTHANELFIVRKIGRTTVMRKHVLKAYSLKTNEVKILQEDCEGHFSTDPELVKLYLPEVLEHLSSSLPLETMLYIRSEPSEDLPLHLTADVVTLMHTAIESSIIASTCWEYERQGDLSDEDRALVAIPIDLDIEVTFLGRESDDATLYESTRSYFEKFNSLKITDMKNSGGVRKGSGTLVLAQKRLYKAVREGYISKATEIKMPYRISGVFDGEISPLARSVQTDEWTVVTPLEAGLTPASCSPSHSIKTNGTSSRNHSAEPCDRSPPQHPKDPTHNHSPATPPTTFPSEPFHTTPPTTLPPVHPYTSPPTTLPPEPPHTTPPTTLPPESSHTTPPTTLSPSNGHTHPIALPPAPSFPTPVPSPNRDPPIDMSSEPEFSAVYTEIDSILKATLKSAGTLSINGNDTSVAPKSTTDVKADVSMNGRCADAAVSTPPPPCPPKPFPRNHSKTDLKPSSEPNSLELRGQEQRIMNFEELSMNYNKLQLEMQELKRELKRDFLNNEEIEAGYDVVSHSPLRRPTFQRLAQQQPRPLPVSRPASNIFIAKATNSEGLERNKEDLRELDHMEDLKVAGSPHSETYTMGKLVVGPFSIISLLECMNLSQYKEQFMREQVDGEILAECDEAMLGKDLHITSAIHRTRLMKVITGRHSALSFLHDGADLYSTLEHPH